MANIEEQLKSAKKASIQEQLNMVMKEEDELIQKRIKFWGKFDSYSLPMMEKLERIYEDAVKKGKEATEEFNKGLKEIDKSLGRKPTQGISPPKLEGMFEPQVKELIVAQEEYNKYVKPITAAIQASQKKKNELIKEKFRLNPPKQSGGEDRHYRKYLKYKHKYEDLKRSY